MSKKISIIGLGPGSPKYLTRQAWELLRSSPTIWVRTQNHPAIEALKESMDLEVFSFDDVYDQSDSFEQVYKAIVEKIIDLALESSEVIYAVPGDPLVGEATVTALIEKAKEQGIHLDIVHGVSFVEPALRLAAADALDGLYLCDALDLASGHHPPFPPDAPALIGQVYSRLVASDVKLTLLNQYPSDHIIRLIHAAGTPSETVEEFELAKLDRRDEFNTMTSLFVPALQKPSAFERFQETVAHLRAPEGCPWDREQTHQSLRSHIMEEAYETLQAIDDDNMQELQEELGDLLLQIVLQAQIATEAGAFRMPDVIAGIQEKLVRRHPHVFDDLDVEDVDQVLHNWESLKEGERSAAGSDKGVLDGVPINLPALAQAEEIQDRVVRVGFDWAEISGVLDKIHEELEEIASADSEDELAREVGDLLFAVVNYARWLDVDAESALRSANRRFRERFSAVEKQAVQSGKKMTELSLSEMEAFWQAAKKDERS